MSTIAFSQLTNIRKNTPPEDPDKPGTSRYVDAMAALVPAEVLALHALLLTFTTETSRNNAGETVTTVTETGTLAYSFWGLLALSLILFLAAREKPSLFGLDGLRALIPPAAFVLWTMLQKVTAFDAVAPDTFSDANRAALALFGAVLLGTLTAWLAKKASEEAP